MLTLELEQGFAQLKSDYGPNALERVEQMLEPRGQERDPRQRDAKWVLPYASPTPWLDPADNPEIQRVTERLTELHPLIKEEARNLLRGPQSSLTQYMHYLFPRDDWNALYFFRNGALVEESMELCPVTGQFVVEDLRDLHCPLLEVHFSVLDPRVRLEPHCDLWNFTINLHFGVDVTGECALRVAGETRPILEGQSLLFDYSFEHDAWNDSDQYRICLLMDIWNPLLTEAERKAVTLLVTTIRELMGE